MSDNKDFPRFIQNGKDVVKNVHRYYLNTIIRCSKCNSIWFFRGIPANEVFPAHSFYYKIDPILLENTQNMSFNDFLDFCIAELRGYKVGDFVEHNIERFLKQNLEDVIKTLLSKREIPVFIVDFIRQWLDKNQIDIKTIFQEHS